MLCQIDNYLAPEMLNFKFSAKKTQGKRNYFLGNLIFYDFLF